MLSLEEEDYRQVLRTRILELKKGPKTKLKGLAEKLGVQYTFMSRALRDSKTQLNEDHLFSLCRLLQFNPQETDYIFLLRQKENSASAERVKQIDQKLNQLRRMQKLVGSDEVLATRDLSAVELRYLLNPVAVLVHVALNIPRYEADTKKIAFDFKISLSELESILLDLEILGMIKLQENSKLKVASIHKSRLHIGAEHPLMRTHQQLLKVYALQRLQRVPESRKLSYMATFTISHSILPKIRELQEDFLKKLKQVAMDSSAESVYQLSLDVFPWADD